MALIRRLRQSADLPWVLVTLGFFAVQYRAVIFQGRHCLFGDNSFQNFPWHYFVWDRVRHGGLTAPCPEMALGFPLFAEPQAQCFYPLNTAWWPIADPFTSFTIKMLLHMLLATAGVYVLARRMGRSPVAACAAAIAMAGGGFMVYRIVHLPILVAMAWTPWILLFFLRALRSWSRLDFLALTGCTALQLLAGHPQTTAYTLLACPLLAIWGMDEGTPWRQRLWRPLALLAGAVALGAVLAIVQLAASYELYLYGWRANTIDADFLRMWGPSLREMAVDFLAMAKVPLQWEKTAFPGTLAWVGVLAAARAWRERALRGWLLVLGVALLYSWAEGNPLFDLLLHVPVLNRFRAPARSGVLIAVAAPLLLAWLVDELRRARSRGPLLAAVGALAGLEAIALLTTGRLGLGPWVAADPLSWQLPLLLVFIVAAALWLRGRLPAAAIAGLTVALVAAELLWAGYGVNPAVTRGEWLAEPTQQVYAAAAQRTRADGSAFAHWKSGLANNVAICFGVRQPRLMTPMASPEMDAVSTRFYGPNHQAYLSAFGVRWVVSPESWAEREELVRRGEAGGQGLFENPLPAPRVYVPEELLPGETRDAVALLQNPRVDPRHTVVLPRDVLGNAPAASVGGEAAVRTDAPTELVVTTRLQSPGVLTTTNLWTPHWRATVDGQPTRCLPTNLILLSAVVPPGEHTVRFTYDAELLPTATVSAVAALLYGLWLAVEIRRRKREKRVLPSE